MKTLKDRLKMWKDWDLVQYEIGVVLGLFPEFGSDPIDLWNGHKGTIHSATLVGESLTNILSCLVRERFVDQDPQTDQYRWVQTGIPERLPIGTLVVTIAVADPSSDWAPEALAGRRFGVLGNIVKHSDAHGLCYEVRHQDDFGTFGWYEDRELVRVDPTPRNKSSLT